MTVIAGAFVAGHLELVDARNRRLMKVSNSGQCQVISRVALNTVTGAVFRGALGWTMIGVDSLGRYGRFRSGDTPFDQVRYEAANNDRQMEQYSASGTTLVITRFHFPYNWIACDGTSRDSVRGLPLDADSTLAVVAASANVRKLLSLPVLALGPGFLQELVDPTSDKRILVLYDRMGKRLRTSTIDVALGFLDANVESRRLIALRTSDIHELVEYSWRWAP